MLSPYLDPRHHVLMIHGLVHRPVKFDLASLERYPMVSRIHFLECAGNSFFNAVFDDPQPLGCDMLHGLVSNAEWTGVPLRLLFEEAGVKPADGSRLAGAEQESRCRHGR
jgi:sulfane dehydrogenase subunit SoxC